MDRKRHVGHTALVTGAASGIGRATAIRLAAEGARVVAVDLHAEPLELVVKHVRHAGGDAVAVVGDVTDQQVVDWAVAACEGHLDVLVNDAGVMDYFLPADAVDDATWNRVLAVNVTAPMRLCRAAIPVMKSGKGGAIVNVASVAGLMGGAAGLAYTVSKHALIGLTRNLATLYGADGIRCNAVCPGGVETHIAEGGAVPRVSWAFERLTATSYPRAQRTADPDELAAAISWLASAEASDVNGVALPVDAGWSAI